MKKLDGIFNPRQAKILQMADGSRVVTAIVTVSATAPIVGYKRGWFGRRRRII